MADRRARVACVDGRTVHGHSPRHPAYRAEQQAGQVLAAGAEQAGDPDDLSRPQRQVDALDGPAGHALGRERRLRLRQSMVHLDVGDLASGDQRDQPVVVHLLHWDVCDDAPVPERHDAIGDVEDLVEAMRDEHDAGTLARHPPDGVEEPVDLVGGQGGGGLVEDQHAVGSGPVVHRPRDRDDRPLGG